MNPSPNRQQRRLCRQLQAYARLTAALILLSACAAGYHPVSGTTRNDAEMAADLADCRDQVILDDEGKTVAGGFLAGAFTGAAHGALAGAIHGSSAEGAAIGAAAGATIGFVAGLFSGSRDVEACMAGRGWTSG